MENKREYLEKKEYPCPHLGQMIKNFMQEKRISQAELARKLGVGSSTVVSYTRNPSIQFNILWKICIALQHDFLSDIQQHLPPTIPEKKPSEEQERIKDLEKEIAIYKSILIKN